MATRTVQPVQACLGFHALDATPMHSPSTASTLSADRRVSSDTQVLPALRMPRGPAPAWPWMRGVAGALPPDPGFPCAAAMGGELAADWGLAGVCASRETVASRPSAWRTAALLAGQKQRLESAWSAPCRTAGSPAGKEQVFARGRKQQEPGRERGSRL